MTAALPSLPTLQPNPDWVSLPIFDRTGWKRVRFGDVVENCAETCDPEEAGLERFVAMEHLEPGSLHMRSWVNVADGTTFTRRCRPGQVLFGKRRAYQRKVAVAEFEAVVSGDIYVLAPKDTQRLLPELLPFLCLSERFFQHAVGTSAGSLSPRTNWSSLASFEFDIPPLDQQRRIAEILWAVDECINCDSEVADGASLYALNLVSDFFPKDATSHVKLGDVGDWVGGGTPSMSNREFWKGDIPWVSPKDLIADEISDSQDHINDVAIRESSTRLVPTGSILIAARTGILRHTLPVVIARRSVAINQDLKALIPNTRFVPEFVASYLRYKAASIRRECVKQGTTVESIDMPVFKAYVIPLPGSIIDFL